MDTLSRKEYNDKINDQIVTEFMTSHDFKATVVNEFWKELVEASDKGYINYADIETNAIYKQMTIVVEGMFKLLEDYVVQGATEDDYDIVEDTICTFIRTIKLYKKFSTHYKNRVLVGREYKTPYLEYTEVYYSGINEEPKIIYGIFFTNNFEVEKQKHMSLRSQLNHLKENKKQLITAYVILKIYFSITDEVEQFYK